jgi:Maltooligosyl trehalose synthase
MAKGLEDTVFYIYNRLAALNEVGGEPQQFGLSIKNFTSGISIDSAIGRRRCSPLRHMTLNGVKTCAREWLSFPKSRSSGGLIATMACC